MNERKEDFAKPSQSQTRLIWRRFRRHRIGLIGSFIVIVLTLIAIFADFLSPYHYAQEHRHLNLVPPMITRVHLFDQNGLVWPPFVYALDRERDDFTQRTFYSEDKSQRYPIQMFAQGNEYHFLGLFETNIHLFGLSTPPESDAQLFLLGTDEVGRDLLSRILIGGRISMAIGPIAIFFSIILGAIFGGLSGFYGGWIDNVIQRFIEIIQSIPGLPLFLLLGSVLPRDWPPTMVFFGIVLIFSLIGWGGLARILRGQILTLREQEFVIAAKAMGTTNWRTIIKHLIPNTMTSLIVTGTLGIPNAILGESALSFLGLGIREPMTSWGLLLNSFLISTIGNLKFHTWLLIPGFFIIVAVLAFNFMGDALRDAADPFSVK